MQTSSLRRYIPYHPTAVYHSNQARPIGKGACQAQQVILRPTVARWSLFLCWLKPPSGSIQAQEMLPAAVTSTAILVTPREPAKMRQFRSHEGCLFIHSVALLAVQCRSPLYLRARLASWQRTSNARLGSKLICPAPGHTAVHSAAGSQKDEPRSQCARSKRRTLWWKSLHCPDWSNAHGQGRSVRLPS